MNTQSLELTQATLEKLFKEALLIGEQNARYAIEQEKRYKAKFSVQGKDYVMTLYHDYMKSLSEKNTLA